MLAELKKVQPLESNDLRSALAAMLPRRHLAVLVPLENLRITEGGRLTFENLALADLPSSGLPLSELALTQLDHQVGISARYASRIDPSLHADSINRLVGQSRGVVRVVVSIHEEGDAFIEAVTLGAHQFVPPSRVLTKLVEGGLEGQVRLHEGLMVVRFTLGTPAVEVLPGDIFEVYGELRLRTWGPRGQGPMLQASVFTLRLVCSNGAVVARREMLTKALTVNETLRLVDAHVARVQAFETPALRGAAQRLSQALPSDEELSQARHRLEKAVGEESAKRLLGPVNSRFDLMNAYTEAAHKVGATKARELQELGGSMLDAVMA
jgi:hypothetical protein